MKYRIIVYEERSPGEMTTFDTEALTPWDAVKIWAGQIEAEETS